MKLWRGVFILTSLLFSISGPATATVAAPSPEIGDGMVGFAVATIALLAFVLYPRLKRMMKAR